MAVPKNIGIIGCGLLGNKRAAVLGEHRLCIAADIELEKAKQLVIGHSATASRNWQEVVNHADVEVVLISTTPDQLAAITLACVQAGKHVLVEKPAGTNSAQLRKVLEQAEANNIVVRVGFNHRFHPAMQKATALLDEGAIGDIMFIRARYGHGGRVGYAEEWRMNAEISGGGELIDQGFHLIDLSRWFLRKEFTSVTGAVQTYFWPVAVEDNAFMLLKTDKNQVAWLQTSWTEWKNLFNFEIIGRHGKLQIDGLGGSYGLEQLAFYKMSEAMGPPETTIWQFPQADHSFALEFTSFMDEIAAGTSKNASLHDAIAAFEIAEEIYGQAQTEAAEH
ncbi:Gfo/Idh/MocA family oxidoreductase [bacterium]|nr:Gfo/Idh/MocA family oxidoreductase [bacterium]MBP9809076.1 Gfo/Idh/MocA family oxidoreductase [bacterium]